jgi:hypothetical protein
MSKYDSPLKNIRIASPCSADWDAMRGDDRKRFCGQCKLNVYNLSGMTQYDAEHLLRMNEGRLCVRYFQRPDGTVLTQDCPVGWAKVKQRVTFITAAVFSMIVSLFGAIFLVSSFRRPQVMMGDVVSARPTPTPTPASTPDEIPLMGAVAVPKQTPKPTLREVKGEFDVTIRKVAPTS